MEYGTSHPDTVRYPDHILVYVSAEKDDKQGKAWIDIFYAANRENQHLYNFDYQGWAAGGKYERYTRQYLIRREDWERQGSLSGDLPDNAFGDVDPHEDSRLTGFVFFGDSMGSSGSQELDSTYVVVTRLYRKHCELSGTSFDPNTGESYAWTEQVVLTSDIGSLPAAATGYHNVITPINCDWSVVRNQINFDINFSRTYYTNRPFYWPAVFDSYEDYKWGPFGDVDAGCPAKYSTAYNWKRRAYNGATKVKIEESFTESSSAVSTLSAPMLPSSYAYSGYKFSLSVPSCLHGVIEVDEWIFGCSVNGRFTQSSEATNYTDWPSSLIIEDSYTPYNGGYLHRIVTAYKPQLTV
tara:strand:- start:853 stop:1911 length:1059 start_codon:yes stop_codon:yes gene_type:complete